MCCLSTKFVPTKRHTILAATHTNMVCEFSKIYLVLFTHLLITVSSFKLEFVKISIFELWTIFFKLNFEQLHNLRSKIEIAIEKYIQYPQLFRWHQINHKSESFFPWYGFSKIVRLGWVNQLYKIAALAITSLYSQNKLNKHLEILSIYT